MRKSAIENTTQVETEKFELKLPNELNPTPQFVVQISPSREVHIYASPSKHKDHVGDVTVYDVYLVSTKSGKLVSSKGNYYRGHNTFHDLPSLKFGIIGLSADENVKKRVSKTVEVDTDDE